MNRTKLHLTPLEHNENINYDQPPALKEKVISTLMIQQPEEVGKILSSADLTLSMYRNVKI